MGKNTSISLGDHFENFIHNEIKSGRYGSVSEVIRTALRLLENEERKLNDVRSALISGEQSGFIENFDAEAHLKSLHKKHIKK
jgi:antitoxin ParD1/3/4